MKSVLSYTHCSSYADKVFWFFKVQDPVFLSHQDPENRQGVRVPVDGSSAYALALPQRKSFCVWGVFDLVWGAHTLLYLNGKAFYLIKCSFFSKNVLSCY